MSAPSSAMSRGTLPGRLNGVAVQEPSGFMDDRGGLGDGLDRARLVIRNHQRNERPPPS